MSSSPELLTPAAIRNLNDKLYEKRKIGALEVEQVVKALRMKGDDVGLASVIQFLVDNFAYSANANAKKGALIALAAVVIGVGKEAYKVTASVVPPVLKCFTDQDSRVRYYACESMYNISKVGGPLILQFFNEIFDNLCKLSADPEKSVRDGAQLLDRLVKDIVRESDVFDIERSIPLLQHRMRHPHPNVRQFLIGWITTLDTIPNLDLLTFLPSLLGGLFSMLGDKKSDISREVATVLDGFLHQLKEAKHIQYGPMVDIMVKQCFGDGETHEFTQYIALGWMHEFVVAGGDQLLPWASTLLTAILPAVSHEVDEIRTAARQANASLVTLVQATSAQMPTGRILRKATAQLSSSHVPTRLAALRWVLVLHDKDARTLATYFDHLFPVLLSTISDMSDSVVRLNLEVMAKISQNADYFSALMHALVDLFSKDRTLQSVRGALIIQQLSLFINPRNIFTSLAQIVERSEDVPFAREMIQTLNIILLTASEVRKLRDSLRRLRQDGDAETAAFFVTLYRAWAHNPASLLSLCLLSQNYEHAYDLVHECADMEVTVDFLVEVDKLVQLLESPIFARLRLQLLDPQSYPFLYKSLYGILMLLPQSTAFKTLEKRLGSVSLAPKFESSSSKSKRKAVKLAVDFAELRVHFRTVQDAHLAARHAMERSKRERAVEEDLSHRRKLRQEMSSGQTRL